VGSEMCIRDRLEGHLSNPGPLAATALLLGLSWRLGCQAERRPASLRPRLLGGLGCGLVVALLLITGAGRGDVDIGTVLAIRALSDDPRTSADQLEQMRARWGDLDELLLREAWARALAGQFERAQVLALQQSQRLQAHPGLADLAERLAQTWTARGDQERAAEAAALAFSSAAALDSARRSHPCLAPEFKPDSTEDPP